MGNYEFYQQHKNINKKISFSKLEIKYKQICDEFNNVYLLNNSSVKIHDNLEVYGTTLWTCDYGFSRVIK